jgi:hypothetical protein
MSPSCCFATASEMKTLESPIFPLGGLMVVISVVGAPVAGRRIGAHFLRPVTSGMTTEKGAEFELILSPWLEARVFHLGRLRIQCCCRLS